MWAITEGIETAINTTIVNEAESALYPIASTLEDELQSSLNSIYWEGSFVNAGAEYPFWWESEEVNAFQSDLYNDLQQMQQEPIADPTPEVNQTGPTANADHMGEVGVPVVNEGAAPFADDSEESSANAFLAMEMGAIDFIIKPNVKDLKKIQENFV